MTMIDTYNRLRKTSWSGIWGKRLLSELQYILELSRAEEGKYDEILAAEIGRLDSYVKENGSITKEICEMCIRDSLSTTEMTDMRWSFPE